MNFKYIKVATGLLFLLSFASCTQKKASFDLKNPFTAIIQDKSLSRMNAEKTHSFQVLYDFEGKTDGCGCSKNPKGGIQRLEEFFKRNRIPFILAGNSFYMSYNINDSDLVQKNKELIKVAEVLKSAQIPFIAPGAADLKHLKKSKAVKEIASIAPLLSVNKKHKIDLAEKAFLSSKNKKVVFLNYISSEDNKLTLEEFLNRHLKEISANKLPVIFSREEFSDIADVAKKTKRALLFIGSNSTMVTDRPMMLGRSLFLQSLNMGQQVASVKLELNPKAESWLIVNELEFFEKRWKQLKKMHQKITQSSSKMQEAKDFELSKIDAQVKQLSAFVPSSKNVHKIEFKLIDIDEALDKPL